MLAIFSLAFSIALQSIAGVLLIISGLLSGYQKGWKTEWNIHPSFYFLIPLILWLLCTALWSTEPAIVLALKFKGFFFFAIFSLFNSDVIQKRWKQYTRVYILSVFVATILCMSFSILTEDQLLHLTANNSLFRPFEKTIDSQAFGAYSPFIDRLHFSYLMGVGALFAAALVYYGHEKLWKGVMSSGLLIIGIFYLGARGGQLAIALAAVIWFSYLVGKKLSQYTSYGYYLSTLGTLLVVSILFFMAFTYVPAVSKRWHQARWEMEQYSSGQAKPEQLYYFTSVRRLLSWKYNLHLIKEHPVFGIGVGDYDRDMQALYDRDKVPVPVHRQQQFLYFWVVGGIPAFLLFVIAMLKIFRWKRTNKPRLLALSIVCFYCLTFLFDTPLNYKVGNMTLGFVLVLLHHFEKSKKSPSHS
jgi:hypothetical protein